MVVSTYFFCLSYEICWTSSQRQYSTGRSVMNKHYLLKKLNSFDTCFTFCFFLLQSDSLSSCSFSGAVRTSEVSSVTMSLSSILTKSLLSLTSCCISSALVSLCFRWVNFVTTMLILFKSVFGISQRQDLIINGISLPSTPSMESMK